MRRTLHMKQHQHVILALRSDISVYDGKRTYRITQDPTSNSREIITICERMERAHGAGDWCAIDDLMDELQSYKIWLYEGTRYIPYKAIGAPCIRQGVMRFRDWSRWDGKGHDFPEQRLGHDFPELSRGHDFAELPDDGYDFPELADTDEFPELADQ